MYEIGNNELTEIENVFNSKKLMRYRGGENGFTEHFENA